MAKKTVKVPREGKTVRIPILHGYVDVSEAKYNQLVKNGGLEAYKAQFVPKGHGGGTTPNLSTHIIPNVRRLSIQ